MKLLFVIICLIISVSLYSKAKDSKTIPKTDNSKTINQFFEDNLSIIYEEIPINENVTIKTNITSEKIAFNINIKF